jgi:methylated-DNA-[protein]-cysteine S-methyltransferase
MPGHSFDTALGRCRVQWGPAGIHRVRLPDTTGAGVAEQQATPPPEVQAAIAAIVQLLATGRADFSAVPLDLAAGNDFERRVWHLACGIPAGHTLTYGQVAQRLGEPGAARAVGAALGRNPVPLLVPCHRVLGADGKLTGFSAPGGTATKARLLAIERAQLGTEPQLF